MAIDVSMLEEMRIAAVQRLLARRHAEGHWVGELSGSALSTATAVCALELHRPGFRQYVEIQGENGSLFGSIQEEIPSYLYLLRPKAGYSAGRTNLDVTQFNLFEEQMKSFLRNLEQGVSADTATVDDTVRIFDILAT